MNGILWDKSIFNGKDFRFFKIDLQMFCVYQKSSSCEF